MRFGEDDLPESSSGDQREPRRIPAKEDDMNENEKEIARINGEARKRGLSYGQYVAASLFAGMPGIGPKDQYPKDSGETSLPNRNDGFDLERRGRGNHRAATGGNCDEFTRAPTKGKAKDAAGQGAAKKRRKNRHV